LDQGYWRIPWNLKKSKEEFKVQLIKKARELVLKSAIVTLSGNVLGRIQLLLFSLVVCMSLAAPAWADSVIASQTGTQVEQGLVTVLNTIVEPIGGVLIFVVVVWVAFQMITTAHKPEERAKVMGSLPYIVAGGLLLGGVMLFSGFILSLASQMPGYQAP
jgi:hypothetical protein